MPYRANEDLPPSVRRHLPPHAQDIDREAFNHALAAHAGRHTGSPGRWSRAGIRRWGTAGFPDPGTADVAAGGGNFNWWI